MAFPINTLRGIKISILWRIKREGQFGWTRAFEFIELLYGMVAGFTVLNFGHYSGNKKCCQRLNLFCKNGQRFSTNLDCALKFLQKWVKSVKGSARPGILVGKREGLNICALEEHWEGSFMRNRFVPLHFFFLRIAACFYFYFSTRSPCSPQGSPCGFSSNPLGHHPWRIRGSRRAIWRCTSRCRSMGYHFP